ncbi:MAG: choice-of-anchor A family protein [Lachnospiraceae bacterium]
MALNFFLANETNVFVFGNHTQSNTFATGKVLVFGNALYKNYNVGADLPIGSGPMFRCLSIAGKVDITGGINYSQDTIYDPVSGSIVTYTMQNQNGAPNQPKQVSIADKDYATDFLYCSSIGWASSGVEGSQTIKEHVLTLTGTSTSLNNFIIDSENVAGSGTDISTITSIHLVVPPAATTVISIIGTTITLNSFTTLMNGSPITKTDATHILWNFPNAANIMIQSDVYGAFLAPYASVDSGDVSIYGTLMVHNLTGSIKAVNNLFTGTLPDLYNPSGTRTCSSFTTTSSTTTTTTTSTTMSTTTCAPKPWDQALTDLIESVALEQTALSHILNAEGEKIQKALALHLSAQELLRINADVVKMSTAITRLDLVLQSKLELFDCDIC